MAKTKTKGTAKTVSDTPVPQPITIRSTNPKIMADNILRLEESIKAADVSANPSGTAEDTLLTTIGIDGKKYNIGASAENVSYNNTNSELTATDTQAAIDELAPKVLYTFTPHGETTVSEALDAMLDEVDLSYNCYILIDTSFLQCTGIVDNVYYFSSSTVTMNTIYATGVEVKASGSKVISSQLKTTGNTFTDNSNSTVLGFTVYERI